MPLSDMWLWMSLLSALLLGCYDVAKKRALDRNGSIWILFCTTALTALFMCPFLEAGSWNEHSSLIFKALLVSVSWISGMLGLKLLPITTVSTIKASRPAIVVAFSIILFGESLSLLQWLGVILVLLALWLLGGSTLKEGLGSGRNKGLLWMLISVISGAASALYDKQILSVYSMEPLFVQSWTNVYITIILGIILIVRRMRPTKDFRPLTWDWTLLLIALLICAADALYFFALKQDGAMLSVVSLIRRSSVIITFAAGALFFKEKKLREKAVELVIMLGGISLLMLGN